MVIANDILIPELARLLHEGKEVRFTPSGVSMRPFIEGDRDSVVLAPINRAPRRGDIVLASVVGSRGATYVLHRLIRVEGERCVLQGDGNVAGTEVCKVSDLMGRVVRIENPKGHRKPLTKGFLWYRLRPIRRYLLKIYRHTVIPVYRLTEKK